MTAKLVVEAIGTFFLVLTIGLVVLDPGAGAMAPLAIGSVLMVMVYAGGHVSGAHYNPAVTVGVLIRGKATGAELVGYVVAQVVAGAAAAFMAMHFKGGGAAEAMAISTGAAFVAEFLFTFALVWVILNVATAPGVEGNSYYGLAIGFTVLVGAYAVGGVSGGAFNPAVTVGIAFMGILPWSSVWLYFIAQLLAAVAAALAFNALGLAADKPTTATPEEQAGLRAQAEPG